MQFFKLVTEFQTLTRRSFVQADPDILKPTNVRPLIDGEWLEIDSSYKMARGGDNVVTVAGTPDDEKLVSPSFVYFAERGRYETQAIQKGPMIFAGGYEADTKVMDGDGLAVGDPLSVWDIDAMGDGVVRRGLAKASGATAYIIGYATRLPADNNGFLRFVRFA